jgi:hypothetical protein
VRNIFVLKSNVIHSGIGRLRMRTTSLAYRTAYVTGIYLTLAYNSSLCSVLPEDGLICPKHVATQRVFINSNLIKGLLMLHKVFVCQNAHLQAVLLRGVGT